MLARGAACSRLPKERIGEIVDIFQRHIRPHGLKVLDKRLHRLDIGRAVNEQAHFLVPCGKDFSIAFHRARMDGKEQRQCQKGASQGFAHHALVS